VESELENVVVFGHMLAIVAWGPSCHSAWNLDIVLTVFELQELLEVCLGNC